jgi:hypothetical protein
LGLRVVAYHAPNECGALERFEIARADDITWKHWYGYTEAVFTDTMLHYPFEIIITSNEQESFLKKW